MLFLFINLTLVCKIYVMKIIAEEISLEAPQEPEQSLDKSIPDFWDESEDYTNFDTSAGYSDIDN